MEKNKRLYEMVDPDEKVTITRGNIQRAVYLTKELENLRKHKDEVYVCGLAKNISLEPEAYEDFYYGCFSTKGNQVSLLPEIMAKIAPTLRKDYILELNRMIEKKENELNLLYYGNEKHL